MPHLKQNTNFYLSHGHKCGDHIDLIDGKPTGAIRISLGYCSTQHDCQALLEFLTSTFVDTKESTKLLALTRRTPSEVNKLKEMYFKISSLYIYPIKSCAPMRIEQKWPFSDDSNGGGSDGGFLFDRQWIIVDNDRVPMTQKRTLGLPRLQPSIDLIRKVMTIRFDGDNEKEKFEVSLDTADNRVVWNGKNGQHGLVKKRKNV